MCSADYNYIAQSVLSILNFMEVMMVTRRQAFDEGGIP